MDSHLEKLKESLEAAVEGLSSEQLNWHAPGKWCAAEVLEHLYLSYTGTINGFERVMKAGKPLATRASREASRAEFCSHRIRLHAHLDAKRLLWRSQKAFRWRRCEGILGQRWRRWMRSSRSVKRASGAACFYLIIPFWAR